jgi:organic radical activating enzyme
VASDPSGASLSVVETFHSLQGEGAHAGRSAFFIRLAGCSVGCPWCDTKHSWPAQSHPQRPLAELVAEVRLAAAAGAGFVVITGGEPLEHDLGPLCAALAAAGLPLHLETSGVNALSGRFDWITLSPKAHRPPTAELVARCDELKVVVHGPADLDFALAMAAQSSLRPMAAPDPGLQGQSPGPLLLVQPGCDCPEGQQLAVAFVQARPDWRLSLQTHKWLGVR